MDHKNTKPNRPLRLGPLGLALAGLPCWPRDFLQGRIWNPIWKTIPRLFRSPGRRNRPGLSPRLPLRRFLSRIRCKRLRSRPMGRKAIPWRHPGLIPF